MKKQMLLGVSVFALACILSVVPAQAQDMGKISLFGGYSYQTSNLGNNCFFSDFCGGSMGLHGYALAGSYNFTKNIGIEASFDGHNGSNSNYGYAPTTTNNGYQEKQSQDIYTYTFGPRVSLPLGNFELFTHFLVGGMHAHLADVETCIPATGGSSTCPSTPYTAKAKGNGMAFKTGAGLDWNRGHWGIRILEVDYIHGSVYATGNFTCSGCNSPSQEHTSTSANDFELSTGVKFNFR